MRNATGFYRNLAIAAILFAAGCSSHVMNFRAVDADTHKPIAGVDVFTSRISHDMVLDYTGSDNWARTDADGHVQAKLASSKPIFRVLFDKRGYLRAAAFPDSEGHTVRIQSPFTPSSPNSGTSGAESDPVEVTMHKDPTVH